MSVIGSTSGEDRYPSAAFKSIGDGVAGRVVATEDYQEKVFGSTDLKFFPSGDPVMGVRITLEMTPGDEATRVTIWAQGKRMLQAIAKAVKGAGAPDIELGSDLALTFTGYDGRAKVYQAAYVRPEVNEVPFAA
jgi:hypothetical protein